MTKTTNAHSHPQRIPIPINIPIVHRTPPSLFPTSPRTVYFPPPTTHLPTPSPPPPHPHPQRIPIVHGRERRSGGCIAFGSVGKVRGDEMRRVGGRARGGLLEITGGGRWELGQGQGKVREKRWATPRYAMRWIIGVGSITDDGKDFLSYSRRICNFELL